MDFLTTAARCGNSLLARDFQPENSPVSPKKAQNSSWEGGDALLIFLSIVWSREKYNVDFHTYIFDVLIMDIVS